MSRMLVRYWGVRGSIPVPGKETVNFGGNTSCVEVRTETARIVIDGGTGLRLLGSHYTCGERIVLLFSHLHWDHIQGFPFFAPIYDNNAIVDIYSGHKANISLEEVLRGQMQAPNFPVELDKLPGQFSFHEVHKGQSFTLDGMVIQTVSLNHPNGATGFRFNLETCAYVHLTDHEHIPEFEDRIVAFCQGADVVSIDAMFTPEEYEKHLGWGHSSWLHAVDIVKKAGAKKLILFHHDPSHSDDFMEKMESRVKKEFRETIAAREGLCLQIG